MNDYLLFVMTHWLLCGLFVLAVLVLIFVEWRGKTGGASALLPQQAVHLMNREEAVVIDVRSAEKYQQGHIIGSISAPIATVDQSMKKLEKYKSQIVIMCAAETGVGEAVRRFKKAGFTKLKLIKGGIAAWQQEGLPLEKK